MCLFFPRDKKHKIDLLHPVQQLPDELEDVVWKSFGDTIRKHEWRGIFDLMEVHLEECPNVPDGFAELLFTAYTDAFGAELPGLHDGVQTAEHNDGILLPGRTRRIHRLHGCPATTDVTGSSYQLCGSKASM